MRRKLPTIEEESNWAATLAGGYDSGGAVALANALGLVVSADAVS